MTTDSNLPTTQIPADDSGRPMPKSGLEQLRLRIEAPPAIIAAIQRGMTQVLTRYGFNSAEGEVTPVPTAEERAARQRAWKDEEKRNKRPSLTATALWVIGAFLLGVALTLWVTTMSMTTSVRLAENADFELQAICMDCSGGGPEALQAFVFKQSSEVRLQAGHLYTIASSTGRLVHLGPDQYVANLSDAVRVTAITTSDVPLNYILQKCTEGGGLNKCTVWQDLSWQTAGWPTRLDSGDYRVFVPGVK